MTSRKKNSSYFVPMPIGVNRGQIGERKVKKMQQQIEDLEQESQRRNQLIDKLSRLQDLEDSKHKVVSDRILDKYHRGDKDVHLLTDEVQRLYGRDTAISMDKSPEPRILDNVIQHRTKEFSQKQQEKALEAKYLAMERQRLQDARQRIQERRRALTNSSSPIGGGKVSGEHDTFRPNTDPGHIFSRQDLNTPEKNGVQSVDSLMKNTVQSLPKTVDRIWKLREDAQKHYNMYRKPYKGELGIQTYHPWQMRHYFMCRSIVQDLVDQFLDVNFPDDIPAVEKEARNALAQAQERNKVKLSDVLAEKIAVQLLVEEMILDETSLMVKEVSKEMTHMYGTIRNMTDRMLMNESEYVSTGEETGRDSSDPAYNIVTRGYFTLQQDRNDNRKDVWAHSQHVHLMTDEQDGGRQERPEILDSDVVVLDFNSFTPNDLRTVDPSSTDSPDVRLYRQYLSTYVKRLTEYWHNMKTNVNKISLASKCRGVLTVQPSPSQRFLCLGTVHGDVLVYDLWMVPWRLVYVVHNESKGNDSVVDISWSLDNTRIISINLSGTMNVWRFGGEEISVADGKKLELEPDDDGIRPRQLDLLLNFDMDDKDFMFQQGSLAEQGALDSNYGPVMSAFFPCLSFFGTQNSICVALDNGDVLKCDMEIVVNPLTEQEEKKWRKNEEEYSEPLWEAPKVLHPTILDESTGVNLLGKQVEAELLRAHKHPLLYLGFVDHVGSLVTVDVKGFINIWKYQRSQLCGLGWYMPSSKYKLQMWEITYTPASAKKPNIVFTDKLKAGAKTQRTRQDIARERQTVQNTIANMQLGDPWHEEYLEEQDLLTKIYAPKGEVSEAGAMFHVIIYYAATDQLSTYLTRMYKPVRVRAVKLLQVIPTPSGRELVFLMLFPEFPPKSAHVVILILDLKKMKLRDFRRNIPLTAADYNEIEQHGIMSADVTKVYGPTGSDYLFLVFKGSLKAISLTTGQI